MRSILRLILWPTLLTLAINIARYVLEVRGVINTASGGAAAPLGITWLVFVFGAWFGWKTTTPPRMGFAALWALVPLLAIIGSIMIGAGYIDPHGQTNEDYETLSSVFSGFVVVAIAAAATSFAIWPRLALTMLAYALPARLTVLVLTWVSKTQGQDTHYTKFGPAGIERDFGETMFAASVAQLGFWLPFTIVGGVLAGAIVSRAGWHKRQHSLHA